VSVAREAWEAVVTTATVDPWSRRRRPAAVRSPPAALAAPTVARSTLANTAASFIAGATPCLVSGGNTCAALPRRTIRFPLISPSPQATPHTVTAGRVARVVRGAPAQSAVPPGAETARTSTAERLASHAVQAASGVEHAAHIGWPCGRMTSRGFGIMIRIKHRFVSSSFLPAATSYVHQSLHEETEHEVIFPAVSSVLLSHWMAR